MENNEHTNPNNGNESGMIGGLVMIAVGVIFLVMQYSDFRLHNWWALFILIPVALTWNRAIRLSIEAGELKEETTEAISGSLFLLFVALIFLFNWDWGQVWPGFIIIAGINALVRGWGRRSD
ncbi:MAG: hypothetical protein HN736_08085 [Anaerolineae bacterium]|jgi:hypothetical protein|nr:hypothetical protein [Anaerolineae bacterium]MBT3712618.1 hypothetical protein [Anaerolineae bacterium]MBT4312319.1 hypothetical protein [Anaerolineae bacterium]MBT4457367.1 hypothetical protein [Anaerolineae bacterium]MBT4842910.1 hypothetical protein [Anaerolineae bacterium]